MPVVPFALVMSFITPISRLLGRNTFFKLCATMVVFLTAGIIGLYYFEHGVNPEYRRLSNAIWAVTVFLSSGLDYAMPQTTGGRVTAVLMLVGGVGLLGLFTATATTFLVDLHRRRRSGMKELELKNHVVLCGWDHKSPGVIAQLTAEATGKRLEVVLIADLEETPIEHPQVHFVRGNPTEDAVLQRAAIASAQTGIVLPLDNEADADGYSLLVVLALRAANPDLYICVEIVHAQHIVHVKRAGANEIVSSTELAANMLSQAALNHGITQFFDQVLSNRYGNEVYEIDVPPSIAGKTVAEAKGLLSTRQPITLLAVTQNDEMVVNPEHTVTISAKDRLLVLAESYPNHLF